MSDLQRPITTVTAWSVQHVRLTLLIIFAAVALSLLELPRLSFDSSADSFLSKGDPQRLAYLDFENQFGLSAYFILLIEDYEIFSAPTTAAINSLEQAIQQQVPNVARTESLITATDIQSVGDDIVIDQFFSSDEASVDFTLKKQQATANPYFLNRLINDRGDTTAVIVSLKRFAIAEGESEPHRTNMKDVMATLNGLKSVVSKHNHFTAPVLIGGSPTITAELTQTTRREMSLFSSMAMLIVAGALFAMFRTLAGVLLPLVLLTVTVIIIFAAMSFFQYPIQVTGAILPSFLLAVCVGDSVHFLKPFYQSFSQKHAKRDAIIYAIRHSGSAMFYTTLTTSLGLLSFSFSNIAPVASFGIFAAAGVWLAFILTITALPALLLILPIRATDTAGRASLPFSPASFVRRVIKRHVVILLAAAATLFTALLLAAQLQFSYNPMSWFGPDNPVKVASERIEQKLTGTMQIELIIRSADSDQPQRLTLDQLSLIDSWLEKLKKSSNGQAAPYPPIHSVMSIIQLLKQSNDVLTDQGYTLPDSEQLLAQQFLLLQFDGENTVASLTDNDLSLVRASLSTPWQDSLAYNRFMQALKADFDSHFNGSMSLEITGMATVANDAFGKMVESMALSYLLALLVIISIMFFIFRNLKLGIMLIIPNTLPILAVMGLMYLFDIPLDLFTMLIGSIAIGIVVDDTIHLVHSFQNYYDGGLSVELALIESLKTTGSALTITTIVLCLGFLIYSFSALSNLVAFGFLTALTLGIALIADFIIVPAIISRIYRQ